MASSEREPEYVLLSGGSVIPCVRPGDMVSESSILIRGDRIVSIGQREAALGSVDPSRVREVDVRGKFCIPGLWDGHIHLGASVPPFEREFHGETADLHMIRCIRKAQDNLRSGITSVRSLGDPYEADLALRDAVESGQLEGPRIFASGDVSWSRRAAGVDEFKREVRRVIQSGADQIKLMSSGGIPWRTKSISYPLHAQSEIEAVVQEAHTWDLPVAVHAMGDETVTMAASAGADTIEHGFTMTSVGVEAMAQAGALYCPNLAVTHAWDPARQDRSADAAWFKRNSGEAAASHHAMFRLAISMGVTIVAGVDNLPPGPSPVGIEKVDGEVGLIVELKLMQQNGMSAGEALLTATRNAAAAARVDDRLGTLEAGKIADVVVLDANPLEDLTALAKVDSVWFQGSPIGLSVGTDREG
jgi:imidazolonepropionase-like amidohydrolase